MDVSKGLSDVQRESLNKMASESEKKFANKLAKGMSAGSFLQSAGSQLGSLNNTQTVGTTARKRVQVRTIQRRQFR